MLNTNSLVTELKNNGTLVRFSLLAAMERVIVLSCGECDLANMLHQKPRGEIEKFFATRSRLIYPIVLNGGPLNVSAAKTLYGHDTQTDQIVLENIMEAAGTESIIKVLVVADEFCKFAERHSLLLPLVLAHTLATQRSIESRFGLKVVSCLFMVKDGKRSLHTIQLQSFLQYLYTDFPHSPHNRYNLKVLKRVYGEAIPIPLRDLDY